MTENKRFCVEFDDTDIWEGNHFLAVAYNHHNAKKITERLNKLAEENEQLKQFKDKVFEVIDNHILEETDLRKECIENGSHYTANISRNIIDTLKLIKKEIEK